MDRLAGHGQTGGTWTDWRDMDRLARLNDDMLPFAKLLGVRFKTAELDRVVAELLVRDELCTRPAVAHGGAVMAFADTLGAAGTILNLSSRSTHDDHREQDQFPGGRAPGPPSHR